MLNNTSLRCYRRTCGHLYEKELYVESRISDEICPKCFKATVELDIGNRANPIDKGVSYETYRSR